MSGKQEFYKKYTTIQALAGGIDIQEILGWSHDYFVANYSKLLPKDKNSAILDLSCGYGRYLLSLQKMGFGNCFGIDISEEQIHTARALGLGNVDMADSFRWLADNGSSYDCIPALDILEHFKSDELLELGNGIRHALKDGGSLILQAPNALAPMNPITYGDLTHERAFTVDSVQQFLLSSGLTPTLFAEVPPHVHGLTSAIRSSVWRYILRPAITGFFMAAYGNLHGGIYTPKLIAVGVKR